MVRNLRLLLVFLSLLICVTSGVPAYADGENKILLKVGSRGEQVSQLQYLLQQAGFFPAAQKVTGYYGGITFGAVVALEKKYGLQVDGLAGDAVWNALQHNKKTVLGYYAVDYPGDRRSYDSLMQSDRLTDQVAMFDFCLDGSGNLKGTASLEGIDLAHQKGAKALMVVHNIVIGGFDRESANSSLSVKSYRKNLIDNIVSSIKQHGYDGVNIDFEGISPSRAKDFNIFLEELDGYLKPAAKLLTVAVPSKTNDDGGSWAGAYDYKTIGRLADFVVIMTYDEHWGGGPPGPVASLPWVSSVLDYATSVMPAEKILMGVACYGYDWPEGQKGRALKWKDIQWLINRYGGVQWDNHNSVPYLTYWEKGVKHQVWFENSYSLAIKLGMSQKYGLGGIGFWRMGFEDGTFWDTLARKL